MINFASAILDIFFTSDDVDTTTDPNNGLIGLDPF